MSHPHRQARARRVSARRQVLAAECRRRGFDVPTSKQYAKPSLVQMRKLLRGDREHARRRAEGEGR